MVSGAGCGLRPPTAPGPARLLHRVPLVQIRRHGISWVPSAIGSVALKSHGPFRGAEIGPPPVLLRERISSKSLNDSTQEAESPFGEFAGSAALPNAPQFRCAQPRKGHIFFSDRNAGRWAVRLLDEGEEAEATDSRQVRRAAPVAGPAPLRCVATGTRLYAPVRVSRLRVREAALDAGAVGERRDHLPTRGFSEFSPPGRARSRK